MLKLLAARIYNPVDALWIALFALAFRDRQYLAALVFVLAGATLSGVLEGWDKRPATTEPEARG